jgi:hypothetical protein
MQGHEILPSRAVWTAWDDAGNMIERCYLKTDGVPQGTTKHLFFGATVRVSALFEESGNLFNVELKEVCPACADFQFDSENNRIVFENILGRKAEVILSFEERRIDAPEDTDSDFGEGDEGDDSQ